MRCTILVIADQIVVSQTSLALWFDGPPPTPPRCSASRARTLLAHEIARAAGTNSHIAGLDAITVQRDRV